MANYDFPRVVVSGMGTVNSLGNNIDEFWNSMMDSKSGAGPITRFDVSQYKTQFACEVKEYDPLIHMNRKEVQRMDLFTQFAISASHMALDDSGLDLENTDKDRIGVIIGSGIGGMMTYHEQQQQLYKRDGNPDRISPFFIPMMISDIAAGQVAIRWNLKGPNYATVSACATSSHALADALMLIQRGSADVMVVGGSEAPICPMGVGGFNAMRAISTWNDRPSEASRPFDADRNGFVMAEGAGILILESEEHAKKRGAKIYAEIAGLGLTDDGFHITQPAPGGEGAVRSMLAALEDAELKPEDVDYLNAHGTSTPHNDKNETSAIKTVFGDRAYDMAISSIKSMTGHLLGAAGAVEAIATILAMQNSIVPPTINLTKPDPDCDLDYTPNKPKEKQIKAALSNTFGFGGHNATLAFKKYED